MLICVCVKCLNAKVINDSFLFRKVQIMKLYFFDICRSLKNHIRPTLKKSYNFVEILMVWRYMFSGKSQTSACVFVRYLKSAIFLLLVQFNSKFYIWLPQGFQITLDVWCISHLKIPLKKGLTETLKRAQATVC